MIQYKKLKTDHLLFAVTILIGLVIFQLSYGIATLDPTNIRWLMEAHHDWGTHYLGWAYFRNDPWTFPLGKLYSYNYPLGTNIGFSDSIPLLALLFKPFSSLLPEDFQYFGFWLLLCFILTGYYTVKLCRHFGLNPVVTIICATLVMANPVLLYRGLHPALCAQWLIIGSIYNYFRSDRNADDVNLHQSFLLLASAFITPYMAAMTAGFSIILPLKNYFINKNISLLKLFLYPVFAFGLMLSAWIVVGMVGQDSGGILTSKDTFTLYSLNLNSFFNPYSGFSSIFPDLGNLYPTQYEGFGYLGAGLMVAVIVAIAASIIRYAGKKKESGNMLLKLLPLVLLCTGMFCFALTNEIVWGKAIVFKYSLPERIQDIGFIFRASGRFAWPFYYLLILGALILSAKLKLGKPVTIGFFVFIAALQFYDIHNLITFRKLESGAYNTPLSDFKWEHAIRKFDAVIMFPPFNYNYSILHNMDYQDICFLAMKAGKPVSNAYLGRVDALAGEKYQQELFEKIGNLELPPNQLFVMPPDQLQNFDLLLSAKKIKVCTMDGFIFVYSTKSRYKADRIFRGSDKERQQLDSLLTAFTVKMPRFRPVANNFKDEGKIKFWIDSYQQMASSIKLRGWAFLKETDSNKGDSISVLLSAPGRAYAIPMKIEKRPDITQAYHKNYLEDAGFYALLPTNNVEKGVYDIGIVIKDKNGNSSYAKSDKRVDIH